MAKKICMTCHGPDVMLLRVLGFEEGFHLCGGFTSFRHRKTKRLEEHIPWGPHLKRQSRWRVCWKYLPTYPRRRSSHSHSLHIMINLLLSITDHVGPW